MTRPYRMCGESLGKFITRDPRSESRSVKRLLDTWLGRIPKGGRTDIEQRLWSKEQSDSASAFWELYLHEAMRLAGLVVELHPHIPSRTARPDFRVETSQGPVFLEAVSILSGKEGIRQSALVSDAQAHFDKCAPRGHTLQVTLEEVGKAPIYGAGVLDEVRQWLSQPRSSEEGAAWLESQFSGGGWVFKICVLPIQELGVSVERRAGRASISGPGRPTFDEAATHDRLQAKARKYGDLDGPLVVAVHCGDTLASAGTMTRLLYGVPVGEDIHVSLPGKDREFKTATRTPIWGRRSRAGPPRVAGVVFADVFLQPWSISMSAPIHFVPRGGTPHSLRCLPWPLVDDRTDLESRTVIRCRLAAGRCFKLPEGWPSHAGPV